MTREGELYDITSAMDDELRVGFVTFPDAVDAASDPSLARQRISAAVLARGPQGRASMAHREVVVRGSVRNASGVRVRVYEPGIRSSQLPALLYVHGGGFITGSLDGARPICEELCEQIGAVVVSADYRLAPENPFPAGAEDVYAALSWLVASADELGIDRSRVAVAGHSAGGGIAAAVALMARDRGEIGLAMQAPVCACLDDRHITPSSQMIRDPRTWNRDRARRAWAAYLGGKTDGSVSAYAAPARAEALGGLAPAFMMVGDLDLLRDENIEYARRLIDAGVQTELHLYPGAFHGFELLLPDAQISRNANAALHAALRRRLHPNQPRPAATSSE